MLNEKISRKFHFNQKGILGLPPHPADSLSREQEYSDSEVTGLKLLISKSGRKYFYFRYCFNYRKKAVKIGEFPMMSVKEARQLAGEHRNSINKGCDPRLAKEKAKQEKTFKEFAMEDYMPFAKTEKKTWKQDLSRLNGRLFDVFGTYSMSAITTKDVQMFIGKLKGEMSASSVNRFLSLLARMFNLAIQWGILQVNPCKGIGKAKELKRERFLTKEEIKRLLTALDNSENQIAANAIKLLLFTGTRKNEILTLEWKHVNLKDKTFFLPMTKNGEPRTVVLNDIAVDVLVAMEEHKVAGNPYVFPSRKGSVSGHIIDPKKVFAKVLKEAKIEGFRLHDLRHTYASILVNNGVSLYKVKELLGHQDISITQRYSHLQDEALREASSSVASVVNSLRSE
jgi:integrase